MEPQGKQAAEALEQGCPNFFQRFSPRAICGKIHKQPGHSLEVKYVLPHLVYLSKLNIFLEFAAGQLTMDHGPQLARGHQFGHPCFRCMLMKDV